jgi:NADPH-dependent glutamate synthase beta subunit-like oxidoreductase/ferredoxin
MPRLTIDGHAVDVQPGDTILTAARKLGLDIPTLCFLERCGPMTSCLVCVVKVIQNGRSRVVPSCGLRAEDGMVVESETDEVRALRRSALELLFSDHVGDCLSPCHRICPLDLNIPRMIRQIQTGRNDEAIATVRAALALPATLGRLCHAPCQNGCRRSGCGGSAAIRDLERFTADEDLKSPEPCLPPRKAATGKRVAIVGAGPAGLAAAYHLLRQGHSCVLFDRNPQAGGTLRTQPDERTLPRNVLDAEIRQIERLGAEFRRSTALGAGVTLGDLCEQFDAVLLATGELAKAEEALLNAPGREPVSSTQTDSKQPLTPALSPSAGERAVEPKSLTPALSPSDGERVVGDRVRGGLGSGSAGLGVAVTTSGVKVDPATYQTSLPKVFAAGSAVKPVKQLVRAMAEGQAAAECVHQFLASWPIRPSPKTFSSVMGRLDDSEISLFLKLASPAPRTSPSAGLLFGFTPLEARTEAARCLHCDCRAAGSCALQHYAELYGANSNRFARQRRLFQQELHPADVIFESGKCILCGICIEIARAAAEPLGLTFVGRGFDVQVSAPFGRGFAEGLKQVAAECVAHCPTGAIVFADGKHPKS